MAKWMIYGANGYSARLAVQAAKEQGLQPVVAGRNREKVEAIAQQTGLEARVFSLDNTADIITNLRDINVVIHCAGPFSATAAPMMEACLQNGTHYADITGEIPVFEHGQTLHERARESNVVLCPGVGFDVIPTDCIAACLKEALPDATELNLAFNAGGTLSPGTAKTSVEILAGGIKIRRNGELVTVPRTWNIRDIDYGRGPRTSAVIPWGDVSTAAWTTGIKNIAVYIPAPGSRIMLKATSLVAPLLNLKPVQQFLKKRIEKSIPGPSAEQRSARKTLLWGEAINASGQRIEARLQTANGYDVTVAGILATGKMLADYQGEGGYFTPSQLFGPRIIESLPGSGKIEIL